MICQDGFITSHAVENIELLEDDKVKAFVGEYNPEQYLLNPKMPMAVGPYATSPFYMESKMNQNEAMKNAKQVILDVADDFAKISGRQYGFFEEYKLEDADYAIVMIGSAAGTTKEAIDALRAQGKKVGLLKLRVFRPFPGEEIAKALAHTKAVAILTVPKASVQVAVLYPLRSRSTCMISELLQKLSAISTVLAAEIIQQWKQPMYLTS